MVDRKTVICRYSGFVGHCAVYFQGHINLPTFVSIVVITIFTTYSSKIDLNGECLDCPWILCRCFSNHELKEGCYTYKALSLYLYLCLCMPRIYETINATISMEI